METLVFERGDFLYFVGAVAPIQPTEQDIEELAFADQLRASAPNESLLWMRGQYVEGDRPNRNGQTWTSNELAIKKLTPRFMPVTVMHDPRTAVGLIADTKLMDPETASVPRTRIDTVLAIWAHRFPAIAEECAANYKQGTLMQSMECTIGHYECLDCGQAFVKLPGGAERANWCSHLKSAADSGQPPRRLLRDPNFTGTGLIFGTRRGATGALDTAYLEIAEEVAEFHERAKADRRVTRRTSVDEITIKRSEYDELKAKASRHDELAQKVSDLETANKTLEKDLEKSQCDAKRFEDEAKDEKAKREKLEEKARQQEFASERLGKLGDGFIAKLPEAVKTKLEKQARKMSDEDWAERLEEISVMIGVKPDTAGEKQDPGVISTEETASTKLGGSPSTPATPDVATRATVIGGLLRPLRPTPPAGAKN